MKMIKLFDFNLMSAQVAEAVDVLTSAPRNTTAFFVNAHCINTAYSDPVYARSLRQSDVLLPDGPGLGHAVYCARSIIGKEPIAVLLPDDVILADEPCLAQMTSVYRATSGNLAATMDVGLQAISSYGALDLAVFQRRWRRPGWRDL